MLCPSGRKKAKNRRSKYLSKGRGVIGSTNGMGGRTVSIASWRGEGNSKGLIAVSNRGQKKITIKAEGGEKSRQKGPAVMQYYF